MRMVRLIRLVTLLAAASPAIAQPASAPSAKLAPAPVTVAGGELDPALLGSADVYRQAPVPAQVPAGKACAIAQRYVDLHNARRFEQIADLFEEDGIVMEPRRIIDRGRTEINAFYDGRMRRTPPVLVAVALIGDDQQCMLEIAAKREVRGETRYALVSIDHFTLGRTGRVATMVAFARPPRAE